ncbi:MAG: hypothetical protein JRJ06_02340 [Deltaproteobacteria bacterium]|nr:hypothetical protein [Deltaproteobacteria bacterium]
MRPWARRSFTETLRRLSIFLTISAIFSPGCTGLHRSVSPVPISLNEATAVISRIQDQDKLVSSFYTTGSVAIKDGKWEPEAHILIAGTRSPLKIKLEITHPWGTPILHILISRENLQILSFNEKRLYVGDFIPEVLSRFLPGGFLSADLVWAVLRGYPNLISGYRIVSLGVNRISLSNRDETEIVDLYPENRLPRQVSYPSRYIDLAFSEFQDESGVYYARQVKVNSVEGKRGLHLKTGKMVFNRRIPERIFVLKSPAMFETVYLDKITGSITE